MVLGFLNGEMNTFNINKTYISLIPKVKAPIVISEFPPIELDISLSQRF